ncbi:ankyrin repeat domain-containing protein [Flavobacterium sp. WC2509]|uniref:ankyrin repeat domain-containing protein n=1 Tax=Flavobacterium sp. WC2509 TaxID=3461406 RepID=UPI00404429E9
MKSKYLGFLMLILTIVSCTSKSDKDKWAKEAPAIKYSEAREKEVWGRILRANDPARYYGSPLYDLAEALSKNPEDNKEITKLIDAVPKESINYQEGKSGMTIGMFALWTDNPTVILKLLDRGLNPNLRGTDGDNLIVESIQFIQNPTKREMILKYIIKKGGDVNFYSKRFQTPLMIASMHGDLESVKILVKAGADPNFFDKLAYGRNSALNIALGGRRIYVVNYLIFEQKVDFRKSKYPIDSKFHPGEYVILHDLRNMAFEINSEKFREKMKLIAYLKTQGLDYSKTDIPDNIKNNHNQDYLSKY